jgi:hypothetical protein
MITNLPQTANTTDVRQFFDKFFINKVSFPVGEIDAAVAFFTERGFSQESAESTAIVLLNQAKEDGVNVFTLLDTLKTLSRIQLNQVVAEVLNAYRESISVLGYRVAPLVDTYESRNILV